MKTIMTFIVVSIFVYVGVNFFALPTFPQVMSPVVGHGLTVYGSMGASAVLMLLSLFFGKGR